MRRSIDDHPFTLADLPPAEDEEFQHLSWGVAISDDYDDGEPRVILTVEEVGAQGRGRGLVLHLAPAMARRLRVAIRDGLREIGEEPGA